MMFTRNLGIFVNQYKSRESVLLFLNWIMLRCRKLLKCQFKQSCSKRIEIDVVIPTVSKDFEILNLLIKSLSMLQHPVNKIFVVAPNDEKLKKFCNDEGLVFIDEVTVLGFGKSYINYKVDGQDRSGWLFQQLLKLSGENFTEMENYLVIDSDTIFVNENCFIDSGKYIFYENEEWHKPYFKNFQKLFGYKAPAKLSFTSHMMIFNHQLLKKMKKVLETNYDKTWYDVYISTSDPNEQSCISDYDTYANWVLHNFPEKTVTAPFYNKSVSRNFLNSYEELVQEYSNYKSISFHSYIDKADV